MRMNLTKANTKCQEFFTAMGDGVSDFTNTVGTDVKRSFRRIEALDAADNMTAFQKLGRGALEIANLLDPAAWAENHPEYIRTVSAAVLGVVGVEVPALLPAAAILAAWDNDALAAKAFWWVNRFCPPYLIRKALEKAAGKNADVIFEEETVGYGFENGADRSMEFNAAV